MRWISVIVVAAMMCMLMGCGDDKSQGPADGNQEPLEMTEALPGGAEMEMVWIEPGTFTMGTTEAQEETLRSKGMWDDWFEHEHPAHEVTITEGFWLGKYELTQGQWESVMGSTPWRSHPLVLRYGVIEDPNNPAAWLSWNDVQAFIAALNTAEGSEMYRLPTEAEWEYACRAGTETLWSFGDDESQFRDYAWYYDNAGYVGEEYGHPVGMKLPNPWGLYDMHGNLHEWVQDWYGEDYYSVSPSIDPTGPSTGSNRVFRGGGFRNYARDVWSASRHIVLVVQRGSDRGARLLRQEP